MLSEDFLKSVYPSLGDFIVFEGYDGVGKTTLAKALAKYLNSKDIQTIYTREPTEYIESIIKTGIEFDIENNDIQSFLLDRFKHLSEVIRPTIEQRKIVLCDRYDWSTLVYQDITTSERQKIYLNAINRLSNNEWIQPNLYVYCYAEPELIQQRLINKDGEYKSINEIEQASDRYDEIVSFFYQNHPNNLLVFEIEEYMTVEQQLKELYLGIEEKLWM